MQTVLTIACSVIGTAIAVITFQKSRDNNIRAETRKDSIESTILSTKLDYISKGVDDIRLDIKAQDRKIEGIKLRLVKVEESAKSAHHRLDSIENEKGSNKNERNIG